VASDLKPFYSVLLNLGPCPGAAIVFDYLPVIVVGTT
jgi:hypothetical protein